MLGVAFLLLFLGLVLLFIEGVVPGGILGTLGALAILFSAYLIGNEYGFTIGAIYLIVSAVAAFVLAIWSFQFFAKRMGLSPEKGKAADADKHRSQIGKSATVVAPCRPTGTVEIDGERFSAQANESHTVIAKGTDVRVVGVNGNQLVVESQTE